MPPCASQSFGRCEDGCHPAGRSLAPPSPNLSSGPAVIGSTAIGEAPPPQLAAHLCWVAWGGSVSAPQCGMLFYWGSVSRFWLKEDPTKACSSVSQLRSVSSGGWLGRYAQEIYCGRVFRTRSYPPLA